MRLKRRAEDGFNMSFLDVMACGLGAVILILILVDFNAFVPEPTDETNKLQQELNAAQQQREQLQKSIDELNDKIALESSSQQDVKLSQSDTSSDQSKLLQQISTELAVVADLEKQLAAIARLPVPEVEPLDLGALVSEVLGLYESSTVSIETRFAGDLPKVLGDATQLRQVIHNLLQNAQDACLSATTPHDTVRTVTIRTQWQSANRRVRLSIRDQGDGFSENILKRAFEPYVTTKTRGTGLGLAVVKKISDEHGSRIDIGNIQKDGVILGAQVSLSLAIAPDVAA